MPKYFKQRVFPFPLRECAKVLDSVGPLCVKKVTAILLPVASSNTDIIF